MREEFVFIGPVCAGKSTVASLVAERLGVPHVELDAIGDAYVEESPDFNVPAFRAAAARSFLDGVRYWEPSGPYAVERVLADHQDCVFDLGAGHSCYLDDRHHERVARALRPFRRVVLLLPCADQERATMLLRDRSRNDRGTDWVHDGFDFIAHWVTSPQNAALATITLHTGDCSPADVADELMTDPATRRSAG